MKILQGTTKNGLQKNKIFLSFSIKIRVGKMIKNIFYRNCFLICLLFSFETQGNNTSCPFGFSGYNSYNGRKHSPRFKHRSRRPISKYTHEVSLEGQIGYFFKDKDLIQSALSHGGSHPGRFSKYFESTRLELLGDAIFSVVLDEMIINNYRHVSRDKIWDWRFITTNVAQAKLARLFQVDQSIFSHTSRRPRELTPQLLANVLEAIVGAVYLDGGYKVAKRVVSYMFERGTEANFINEHTYIPLLWKTTYIRFNQSPDFQISERRVRGKIVFVVTVRVNGRFLGKGRGPNKNQAKREAALSALEKMGLNSGAPLFGRRLNGHSPPEYLYFKQLKVLGNSVFVLFANDILMKKYPDYKLGHLVKLRESLLEVFNFRDLNPAIYETVNRFEYRLDFLRSRGYPEDSMLDTFKLVLGATYLFDSPRVARDLVRFFVREALKKRPIMVAMKEGDYKDLLRGISEEKLQEIPRYKIKKNGGAQNGREFVIEVEIGYAVYGIGTDSSKKRATQAAAFSALQQMGVIPLSRTWEQ